MALEANNYTARVADALLTGAQDNGGASVHHAALTAPRSGFVVSLAGFERRSPLDTTGAEEVERYVREHYGAAAARGAFFGSWVDEGLLVLDLSVNVADEHAALALGRRERQDAIYAVETGAVIPLG